MTTKRKYLANQATYEFWEDFSKLKKKGKGDYDSLSKELAEFLEHTPDEVFQKGEIIKRFSKDARIVKVRLKNRTLRKGTRGGYRVFVYVNLRTDQKILMIAYPKTGRLGIENVSDSFVNERTDQLTEAYSIDDLLDVVIEDGEVVDFIGL